MGDCAIPPQQHKWDSATALPSTSTLTIAEEPLPSTGSSSGTSVQGAPLSNGEDSFLMVCLLDESRTCCEVDALQDQVLSALPQRLSRFLLWGCSSKLRLADKTGRVFTSFRPRQVARTLHVYGTENVLSSSASSLVFHRLLEHSTRQHEL